MKFICKYMNKKQKKILWRILLSAAGMIALHFLPFLGLIKAVAALAVYALIGYDILRKALLGIKNKQVFDENFLMAIATTGAIILAFYEKSYDFTEAIAVMLFYQVGELFQSYAVGKSRKSIAELMDIRPDTANIEKDGKLEVVDPEEVAVGSIIVVQPGEKIPLDGVVVRGTSDINTAALTGESLPRTVAAGENVISGCINLTGVLTIRTTKEFGESTVSKILELVEESAIHKSKSEGFISKFARVYTPAVCYSALALAVLPPIVSILFGNAGGWGIWLYRALIFLVISCPCALVISIPLSFFAGIGGAGRLGILIKGGNYLEALSKTKVVVFDKTGTLTQGSFAVTEIHETTLSKEMLLEYAAYAECASSHPISKSLRQAYGKSIDRSRVGAISEISGKGVIAIVDGKKIAAGNHKLMEALSIPCAAETALGTQVHIAVDNVYGGYLLISDTEKPTAKKALSSLKALGITKTVMLTGDTHSVAKQTAENLGVDDYFSQLLPEDKVAQVEALLGGRNELLAFVGDGINDAPVLTRADIGIAMGAMGSDAAIEAADVVLMDDDPLKIAVAIERSRKCMRIVHQNIVFTLGIKFACLALGALGMANMWFAIFADVGVMVLAILNAMRALRT